MVELIQVEDGWKASFDGWWEVSSTALEAYKKLANQPATDINGKSIKIGSSIISFKDAWTLEEI